MTVSRRGSLERSPDSVDRAGVGHRRRAGSGRPSSWRAYQRGGEVATGRGAADDDVGRAVIAQQHSVRGNAIVEGRRVGMVGRHPVVDRPDAHTNPGSGGHAHRATTLAAAPDHATTVNLEKTRSSPTGTPCGSDDEDADAVGIDRLDVGRDPRRAIGEEREQRLVAVPRSSLAIRRCRRAAATLRLPSGPPPAPLALPRSPKTEQGCPVPEDAAQGGVR